VCNDLAEAMKALDGKKMSKKSLLGMHHGENGVKSCATVKSSNNIANFFFVPLPFGGSTVLSLTRGPAENRSTASSLSAPQE